MPPALHACAAKQVVSSPMLLCRARQSPLAESFMQRMHPAKFPARLELYHARACAPILSVGSGAHSHDDTGDCTKGRDLGAGPHRLNCRSPPLPGRLFLEPIPAIRIDSVRKTGLIPLIMT